MRIKSNYKKLILIQLIEILHCFEEYFFGFSDWATRHFGTTTQSWYFLSHLFIFIGLGILAFYAYKGNKLGIFFSFVVQIILFTNGLFHIATTIVWQEYSPGVITQILIVPITYIVFRGIKKNRFLSTKEMNYALLVGCIISALIIASLWIDVPV